jgi:hypothetical protein
MTKPEMMASLDDVFTDRRLNRALVEEALAATTSEPVPILSQCTALASWRRLRSAWRICVRPSGQSRLHHVRFPTSDGAVCFGR